jgi:hypothetical protein
MPLTSDPTLLILTISSIATGIFLPISAYFSVMKSEFGRGFVVNLVLLAKHFGLPPEKAFYGASDHLDDLIVPDQFKGTEVEELVERLRKQVIWHQPGTLDKEDAADVRRLLNRIAVTVDNHLGIADADTGKYD